MYGADLSAWEGYLNRPANSLMVVQSVATRNGWDNYEGSAWYLASTESADRRLTVAVGFFPDSVGGTMAEAAAGSYNAHYRVVAEQLASYGHDDAIIRVAWEFNGDWYPWGYLVPGQDQDHYAKNYRAAFRKLVNSFRRVSPNFQFVWNPALEDGNHMPTYRHTYPGDAYVDCIGPDVYDNSSDAETNPATRWAKEDAEPLADIAQMAAEHGKPVCVPEWGVGDTPIGDNPYFINAMADWLASQPSVGYAAYWSGDQYSGYQGDLDLYPNAKQAYIDRFSAH
jgi:hypothetical protein